MKKIVILAMIAGLGTMPAAFASADMAGMGQGFQMAPAEQGFQMAPAAPMTIEARQAAAKLQVFLNRHHEVSTLLKNYLDNVSSTEALTNLKAYLNSGDYQLSNERHLAPKSPQKMFM